MATMCAVVYALRCLSIRGGSGRLLTTLQFGDSPFASMSFADGVNLIVSQDTRVTVGGIEYPVRPAS